LVFVTQARPIVDPQGNVWLLHVTFFLLIAGFALGNVVMLITMRGTQAANRRIVENAIVGIEDVSRIVHDIDEKRLLIDQHIFETTNREMVAVETRIRQPNADLESVSRSHEPLTSYPGEYATWESLRHDLADLRQPIERVLDLSRNNKDIEARAGMLMIE